MFDLNEFLHHFERVRERTRRVAACIPAEHIDWTYKPGAFTLGDLGAAHRRHRALHLGRDGARPSVRLRVARQGARGRTRPGARVPRSHARGSDGAVPCAHAGGAGREVRDAGRHQADDVEVAADDARARADPPGGPGAQLAALARTSRWRRPGSTRPRRRASSRPSWCLRAARRHGEADAGQAARAEPRRSPGRCPTTASPTSSCCARA